MNEQSHAPLRILVGLESTALGGTPINALDLAAALRERGHDLSVFAVDEPGKESVLPYAERLDLTPTILPPGSKMLVRAAQIHALARQWRADLVHVYGPWLTTAAAVATGLGGRRSLLATNWTMENVYYTRSVPVIVGTEQLRREAATRLPAKVWLLEPTVDTDADRPDTEAGEGFRASLGIRDEEVVAVIVTRLDRNMKLEGILQTVAAVEQLSDPRLRLVVVGGGDGLEEAQAAASEVNRRAGREAVLLYGPVIDPHPAYAAADILLGMGGSALRGLAHRKPLIVLGVNGFARIFEESSACWFGDKGFYGTTGPQDPVRHLADLLQQLMSTPVREELGVYGLNWVRDRFAVDVATTRLEDIYRTTLADAESAPRRALRGAGFVARYHGHVARRTLAAGVGRSPGP